MRGLRRDVDLVQDQIRLLNERVDIARLEERVNALGELMEAKFVTFRTLLDSNAKQVELALNATQEAINKRDQADEKARDRLAEDTRSKFAGVNELRGALEDSQRQNLTRSEFEVYRQANDRATAQMRETHSEQLSDLKERLDKAEGRSGGFSGAWGVVVAVIGIALALVALVFRNT